ncbi:homeodomain-interacting protein kinase 1-like isoform 1-T2 [Synchiropus picturatus]
MLMVLEGRRDSRPNNADDLKATLDTLMMFTPEGILKPVLAAMKSYSMLGFMGQGSFGYVVKCKKVEDEEEVVLKISKVMGYEMSETNEISMLQKLRQLDSDAASIIRCYEFFRVCGHVVMVLEKLDITISDYMDKRDWSPVSVESLKIIMKDIASACKALRDVGVIHSDINPDNVMLVDQIQRPFRVKLIDFGEAQNSSDVRRGCMVQTLPYRAPEVILGLQYNEAIDIWSLAMMITNLSIGSTLCPGRNNYETLRCIMELLGKPPKKMLDDGIYTMYFFSKCPKPSDPKNTWTFKCPLKYEKQLGIKTQDRRRRFFSSLDEIKQLPMHNVTKQLSADISACIELLKKMLHLDPKERINADEVLLHPFVSDLPQDDHADV